MKVILIILGIIMIVFWSMTLDAPDHEHDDFDKL